jgi:hypothetical protein
MTSKQAIKKLNEAHPFYSLEFNLAASGVKDVVAVSGIIRLLESVDTLDKGKQTVVKRALTVYGLGPDVKLAQQDALVNVVEILGF